MSQQEFMPESQGDRNTQEANEASTEAERFQQPYNTRRTSDMPKQEQISSFAEDIPPYSYRAQDTAPRAESARDSEQAHAQQPPAGRYERTYTQRQRPAAGAVPQWARAQRTTSMQNQRLLRMIVIVALLLFVLPLLLRIFLVFLALFAALAFGIVIVIIAALIFIRLILKPKWPFW